MKKVFVALIFFTLVAGGMMYVLHRREKASSRPAVPPKHAEKGHERPVPAPAPIPVMVADTILIEKKARRLTLFRDGKPIRKFKVSLGFEPEGKKNMEGDGKTPEGCYIIDYRNENSKFYRALHISYPNKEDRRQAAELGVSPGSDIMIHGLKNGFGWIGKRHLIRDWTQGCVAVSNREMDEIWRLVPIGAKVQIVP
ncbi:MAG TPA: L,D-transpeptidase family protein [Geobacteraceae bacterium]|nr:L,D-transpeptidase family protein [Geobacteraceae bacterium]